MRALGSRGVERREDEPAGRALGSFLLEAEALDLALCRLGQVEQRSAEGRVDLDRGLAWFHGPIAWAQKLGIDHDGR